MDDLTLQTLRALYREVRGTDPAALSPSTDLEHDLGLGSLERVELAARLPHLDERVVFGARTLGDLLTPPAPESLARTVRGLSALALTGLPLLLAAPLGPRVLGPLVPRCSRTLLGLIGATLHTHGPRALTEPCLVVANHASLLDPVVVAAWWTGPPLRFAIATWVGRSLFLRPLIRTLGHVRVRRGDPRSAMEGVRRMQDVLEQGGCLATFPEGGIGPGPGVRLFATGPFLAATRAGVPVLPVALRGTRGVLRRGSLSPRPGPIVVTAGPLLQGRDPYDLARRARESIVETCQEPAVDRRNVRQE